MSTAFCYKYRPLTGITFRFFNGFLTAHGVVKDRSGKVIRYFNAEIQAYWEGSVGTLKEDFVFDDGEKQQRIWTLMNQDRGQYVGTANDVIGDAKGEVAMRNGLENFHR